MTVSALLHPLDVVKTRMQMDVHGKNGRHRSLFSSFSISLKEGGIWRGLYLPGLSASAIREMLSSGPRAGLYVPVRDLTIAYTGACQDSIIVKLSSSMVCGMVGSLIANPVDVVKVRLMAESLDPSRINKSGSSTVGEMRAIIASGGLAGLYRGLVPSTLRGVFIAAGELGTYDIVKSALRDFQGSSMSHDSTGTVTGTGSSVKRDESLLLHVAASLVTGVVAAAVAAPFDLLKTRYMGSGTAAKSRSLFSTTADLFREEGVKVFFRGFAPSYLRLGPHALLCFPLFEWLRELAGLGNI